jgi:hypothetical protein
MAIAIFLAASAAALGISSAAAQRPSAYTYCLLTGPDRECGFTSFQQCEASRFGNTDYCQPISEYPRGNDHSRMPQ